MQSTTKKRWLIIGGALLIIIVGFLLYVNYDLRIEYQYRVDQNDEQNQHESSNEDDRKIAAIKRGEYVAIAADCFACHTQDKSAPFAGGYPLNTPFGTILSANITPDIETGIGRWSSAQFDRAVRHGKGTHGYLYPAMPYNAYTLMNNQDLDDLWAFMENLPAIKNSVVENQLSFPFNQRWLMAGWNILFLDDQVYRADPLLNELENRGAYLVKGLGHCSTCHTAKNRVGGDQDRFLEGGLLAGWFAPNLTSHSIDGLGKWSIEDIVIYLHSGANRFTVSSGPMSDAIEHSTQYLTNDDRAAIAHYLKSLPAASHAKKREEPIDPQDPSMQIGQLVYETQCIACHRSDGLGVREMIPTLINNAQVNADDPTTLLHILMLGSEGPFTHRNPTNAGMPRFDWKLSDDNIADLLTYIRNSWGNQASKITTKRVSRAREALKADDWYGKAMIIND